MDISRIAFKVAIMFGSSRRVVDITDDVKSQIPLDQLSVDDVMEAAYEVGARSFSTDHDIADWEVFEDGFLESSNVLYHLTFDDDGYYFDLAQKDEFITALKKLAGIP